MEVEQRASPAGQPSSSKKIGVVFGLCHDMLY